MYKLYVGGLPYSVTDEGLERIFSEHGKVASAKVIIDRDSGNSKGFGFVEFENTDEGKKAEEALNGQEVEGRKITVSEARPQKPRRDFGGGSKSW